MRLEKYIVQELIYALEITGETLLGGKKLEARGQVLRRDCLLKREEKKEREREREEGRMGKGEDEGDKEEEGEGEGEEEERESIMGEPWPYNCALQYGKRLEQRQSAYRTERWEWT